jgi:hypothetical protein
MEELVAILRSSVAVLVEDVRDNVLGDFFGGGEKQRGDDGPFGVSHGYRFWHIREAGHRPKSFAERVSDGFVLRRFFLRAKERVRRLGIEKSLRLLGGLAGSER